MTETQIPDWQTDHAAMREIRTRTVVRRAEYLKTRIDNEVAFKNDYYEHVWSCISQGLVNLAIDRPTGDDSVFDYWPGALEAITVLYDNYADGGPGVHIQEHPVSFLYEALPSDIAMNIEAAMLASGFVLDINEDNREHSFTHWPIEQWNFE